jgi:hypothetical protein
VQARLQRDIAWFNPAHEDNYYIAAAILPWNGQVDAAQYVLRKASDARTFDWYPLFHYGFLFYHFRKDPATGAQWLLKGVPRVRNQQDEWALQNVAARVDREGLPDRQCCRDGRGDGADSRAALSVTTCRSGPDACATWPLQNAVLRCIASATERGRATR